MRYRTIIPAWIIIGALAFGCVHKADTPAAVTSDQINRDYLDPEISVETRAQILLEQMTLAEKVGQMTQVARDFIGPPDNIRYYGIGSILSGGGSSPDPNTVAGWRHMVTEMQEAARSTRLGIPLLYGNDSVHGQGNVRNAVIFPHNIGLGAADNVDLVREIGRITTVESAATGVTWSFSPCLAVARDIRWGRTYESFSADPEVVSRLGLAMTQGLQAGLNTDTTLIACLKHFVADGGTANGDDRGNAVPSNNELEAVHLYPYLASLDAGAATVMASYSSVNGTPMHAATQLLTGVLKTELDFPGFVVSDWAALDHLPGDRRVQIATAINAGVDMVMVPDDYVPFIRHLTSLVEDGVVSAERINDAVRRILVTKIRMGLFEHAVPNPALEPLVGSAAHRAVARQAVAQSQVLLKNNGVLPLAPDQRVLLVGKAGNSIGIQCGGWTLTWQGTTGNENRGTTILEALVAEVGEVSVTYRDQISERAEVDPADFDVVVFVGGELPYAEGRGDAARPAVSESDVASASMLAELGLPVVSLLISGRPLLLDGIDRHSDALVASWLPGTEAAGITDVLFGHEPFTGTLPFAWPADESGFTQGQPDDVYRYPLGYGLMVPAWSAKGLTTSTP